jgi:DNA-3-methyladenine glycosylase II
MEHGNNAKSAALVRTFGQPIETSIPGLSHLFPLPEVLAEADLVSAGIEGGKAETIRALAASFSNRKIPDVSNGSSSLRARISALPGLDEATSQYIGMRAFGEPDAFRVPAQWRPWGAYAAMYQWVANAEKVAGSTDAN